MKKRIFLSIFLAYNLGPLVALAADIGVLNLGPLHLTLPPTWKFDGSKNPIEGFGPEGEEVLISIARSKPPTSASALPSTQDLAVGFSKDKMPLLAQKNGKTVLRPVTAVSTPEGKVAFSAASESLVYLVVVYILSNIYWLLTLP